MAYEPFKRLKLSDVSEADELSRLRGLTQANAPLQLLVDEQHCVELAYHDVRIQVPAYLSARCTVLQNAPGGQLRDVVELFVFWLTQEWSRSLNEGSATPRLAASRDSIDDIFKLLKACLFLGDEPGLDRYCNSVYGALMDLPFLRTLPNKPRLHYADASNPLFELLADLPADLVHRILALGPLPVLDRLPLGCRLAPEAIRVFNDGQLRSPQQYPVASFRARDDEWNWRSAAALRAGVPLRVSVSHDEWTEHIRDQLPGLHAYDVHVNKLPTADFALPESVEELSLCIPEPRGVYRDLTFPSTLRKFRIYQSSSPTKALFPLSDLRLPDSLLDLRVNVDDVSLAGVTLPPQLSSLTLARTGSEPPQDLLDLSTLRLPATLRVLALTDCNLGLEGFKGVQLPPSLTALRIARTGLGAEAIRALERHLPALQELDISDLDLAYDAMKGAKLPAKLTKLDMEGEHLGNCGLELPADLSSLRANKLRLDGPKSRTLQHSDLPPRLRLLDLSDATLGESYWLSRGAALPRSLTRITLEGVQFGTETLKGVRWPSELQKLSIVYADKREPLARVLTPDTLPDSLRELRMDCRLSLKGVKLPNSLTWLNLSYSQCEGDDALASIAWPAGPGLQRLDLSNTSFGSAADVRNVRLPDSITALSLQSTRLGRDYADSIALPRNLRALNLNRTEFGPGGIQCVVLPRKLQALLMVGLKLGDRGYEGFALPDTVQLLVLQCYRSHGDSNDANWDSTFALPTNPWASSLKYLVLYVFETEHLQAICGQLRSAQALEYFVLDDNTLEDEDLQVSDVYGWLESSRAKVALAEDEPCYWLVDGLKDLCCEQTLHIGSARELFQKVY